MSNMMYSYFYRLCETFFFFCLKEGGEYCDKLLRKLPTFVVPWFCYLTTLKLHLEITV